MMRELNYLLEKNRLRNRYLVMRHGHSLANEAGIIVSHPDNGCHGYGLSELGRAQVELSLECAAGLDHKTLIISSDFRRALESAQIAHAALACKSPVKIEPRLRERYFGELELTSDQGYGQVWRADADDPDSELGGMESANRVMQRMTAVVVEIEAERRDATVLLVSHGDALQLLQTAFQKQDASRHRSLPHLDTAEIRRLELA
jgi:probable phosphoglycerate mutase